MIGLIEKQWSFVDAFTEADTLLFDILEALVFIEDELLLMMFYTFDFCRLSSHSVIHIWTDENKGLK